MAGPLLAPIRIVTRTSTILGGFQVADLAQRPSQDIHPRVIGELEHAIQVIPGVDEDRDSLKERPGIDG